MTRVRREAQAIKLRDEFIELYRKSGPTLSSEKLKDAKLGWDDIFEEIPIVVHNSSLVTALMAQVRCAATFQHAPRACIIGRSGSNSSPPLAHPESWASRTQH